MPEPEQESDHEQVGEHLADQAQGDDQVVATRAKAPEIRAEIGLNAVCAMPEPQRIDDPGADEEGKVVGGIGQHAGDAVEIAENARVEQRAREDPGRDLGQHQSPHVRRLAAFAGAAKKLSHRVGPRRQIVADRGDGDQRGEQAEIRIGAVVEHVCGAFAVARDYRGADRRAITVA
jgi:hypothetical protein